MDNELARAIKHGLINQQPGYKSPLAPTLIDNIDLSLGDCLNEELASAKSFILAVAFITEGGLLMLKTRLADLAARGIRGKIITSTYLGFNQPKMFTELLKLTNVDVYVVDEIAFHTKAYYIEHADYHTILIGSGNLTATALQTNTEWTVKLNSLINAEFTQRYLAALAELLTHATPLTATWVTEYAKDYQQPTTTMVKAPQQEHDKITPNKMQASALAALASLRNHGESRGLVVSATGTGKTYLAAFDAQQAGGKKILFIAHREQLLVQAQLTFKHVFGARKSTGIFSGNQRQPDAEIIFATIQTLVNHYEEFEPNTFDYIIIDETHRAAASSYQLLFSYFKPQFLLGLTATPERTDGFNVYELFDYNLAYEISLADALEADMLVPFNYIGVADYTMADESITEVTDLKYLVADERVNYLLEKTTYYGYAGEKLRGLIFVSRVDEGRELALKLTQAGHPSVCLSAQTSNSERQHRINQLAAGELEYLLAVDIFNEGVDIPSVNQIVMMRSTQSKIVFLQQLGRGLRRHPQKEYLTVIDFIGNYQNNYLIPQAFEPKIATDKDYLRLRVLQPQISGLSTINFERIAAQRILDAVKTAKFDSIAGLRQQFQALSDRIGRIPTLFEVWQSQQIDLTVILTKFKTYPDFVAKMTGQHKVVMAPDFAAWLQFISQELLLGKRRHELLILEMLLKHDAISTLEVMAALDSEFHNGTTLASILQVLGIKEYFTAIDRRKYGELPLVTLTGDVWRFERQFSPTEKILLEDCIKTGLAKLADQLDGQQQLTLYQKYRRKDVVRVLNWASDLPSIDIGGYKYDATTQTLPIFITVEKNDQQATALTYDNTFIAPNRVPFYSKANRTLTSPVEEKLFNAVALGIMVPVFVKKSDDEGSGFYYVGEATVDQQHSQATTLMNQRTGKMQPVVRFELVLNHDVPHHLWEYLVQ